MTDETGPDWAAIRLAVESGEGTLEAIAAEHGLQRSAISMRKFRGGWLGPADIKKLMRVEAGLESLAETMMRRLKKSARHADALNARALELAHARCGDKETLDRLERLARSLSDMQPVLKMTADLTRLMERKARASADLRATHAALEAKHDRPDFIAFERAVLARIAAAHAGDRVEEPAARDVEGGCGVLAVPEERGADAA